MNEFVYRAPHLIELTDIVFDEQVLATGHCGLFRAPLNLASGLMPSMHPLIASAPVSDPENWELDIKVHMLMKDQYPCIPNWHCDNVPRREGRTSYDLIGDHSGPHMFGYEQGPPMYLWLSDVPTTEFLAVPFVSGKVPQSHADVAQAMRDYDPATYRIQPNAWYSMDQATPHRGRPATRNGWRVFARLTHKSIAPARPVLSVIRRHAQVYLEADHFTW